MSRGWFATSFMGQRQLGNAEYHHSWRTNISLRAGIWMDEWMDGWVDELDGKHLVAATTTLQALGLGNDCFFLFRSFSLKGETRGRCYFSPFPSPAITPHPLLTLFGRTTFV